MKRAIVIAGAAALLASGAAAAQETAPAPAQEPPKCAIRVNDVDLTTWREVRADGFTFCVPPEWNPRGRTRDGVDPREWRGPSGSIEWGKGRPRPVMGSSIVTVPRGERPPPPPPPQRLYSETETIGGAEANVWSVQDDGRFDTGAAWERPAVWLQGRAFSDAAAREQLVVFRTVRFAPPPSS